MYIMNVGSKKKKKKKKKRPSQPDTKKNLFASFYFDVVIHVYRSSPLVPLDRCLTAAACLSSAFHSLCQKPAIWCNVLVPSLLFPCY